MNITAKSIVGELVAEDYRTATVFKQHKIDFCCKGNRTIDQVCENKQLDATKLIEELNESAKKQDNSTTNFASWDSDLLADYIEKKHHRYVENKIPELQAYLRKIAKVHGQRHLELIEIEQLFTASAHELLHHMQKEEFILFPFIRAMKNGKQLDRPHFGTVENPIKMMMHEHDNEGERFRKIATLSNDYTPPADACTTYKVAFAMLKEFEEDLHLHIHLENNILFPKAIEAEKTLNYA
ncbi:iron-sulfur cluster repair di-iron protein [Tenacibaculum sp. UWU-22]|uniref:iron-sulfur cluster repair di-iron protein n=1 Tax=Tenacibaculum sp. UWU-22 TaxID=3234187 RepID=UPI0034DB332C